MVSLLQHKLCPNTVTAVNWLLVQAEFGHTLHDGRLSTISVKYTCLTSIQFNCASLAFFLDILRPCYFLDHLQLWKVTSAQMFQLLNFTLNVVWLLWWVRDTSSAVLFLQVGRGGNLAIHQNLCSLSDLFETANEWQSCHSIF